MFETRSALYRKNYEPLIHGYTRRTEAEAVQASNRPSSSEASEAEAGKVGHIPRRASQLKAESYPGGTIPVWEKEWLNRRGREGHYEF
jgi:hypothetical protein